MQVVCFEDMALVVLVVDLVVLASSPSSMLAARLEALTLLGAAVVPFATLSGLSVAPIGCHVVTSSSMRSSAACKGQSDTGIAANVSLSLLGVKVYKYL
mmetsp:Transcript_48338/g.103560  ORF Transcript_48338/g.103560 Transcript_48338/m.103560 type:complete len:99 (+) Transcript_48338:1180-1476(+)